MTRADLSWKQQHSWTNESTSRTSRSPHRACWFPFHQTLRSTACAAQQRCSIHVIVSAQLAVIDVQCGFNTTKCPRVPNVSLFVFLCNEPCQHFNPQLDVWKSETHLPGLSMCVLCLWSVSVTFYHAGFPPTVECQDSEIATMHN